MTGEIATGVQTPRLGFPLLTGEPLENSSGSPDSPHLHFPAHPKLRNDLIVSRQTLNEGTCFVIKDPLSGKFFRFQEAEYFIAQQLDGSTSNGAVCERVEQRFNARLELETLESFVKTLRQHGLLETAEGKGKGRGSKRGWLRGNLLFLRVKVCDPDRLFNRLAGKVRFCFTRYFMALSAAVILLAIWVVVFNWEELLGDVSGLYRWAAIPMVWVIILVVTTAHEFGHGVTCKHFGGEVHELGFLLIYLQPALYCNVSDAWLFSEKSKRLWVSFAGPYLELFLWALAALAWRVTDGGTLLHQVALAVTATSGIKNLLNFNPLIKMDGYYLLSDYLEVPNLRRKSFACIGNGIKRLFGGRPQSEGTPRERRILFLYGLIASVFSFWLLGYMALKLGAFMDARRHGWWGVLVMLGLFGLKIRRRIRRLFPESTEWFKLSKRTLVSWRRPIITWGLVVVAAGVFLGRMNLKVTGPFRVLPLQNADVRSEVEGIVEEIYVDEGAQVQKGDLIARLSDRDYLAELRKTEAQIQESRAKLRLLEAGPRREEIEVARADVAKATEAVPFAASRLERNRKLYEDQLVSKQEVEDSEANLADRKGELAAARSRLEVLLAGSRSEDIDATKAEIARLETQQCFLEEQVRLVRVVSPAAGIVATPSRQLKEMVHQLVKKGDLIAKVFEMKTIEAQTPIPENEIADIKVGETVVLKARAYPNLTFYGKVTSVATMAQTGSEGKEAFSAATDLTKRTFLVTTEIDNGSLLLKPEMTGTAKILCGKRRVIGVLGRRVARTFKVEFWSWW